MTVLKKFKNYEKIDLFQGFFSKNPLEDFFIVISPLDDISFDSSEDEMEAALKHELRRIEKLMSEPSKKSVELGKGSSKSEGLSRGDFSTLFSMLSEEDD